MPTTLGHYSLDGYLGRIRSTDWRVNKSLRPIHSYDFCEINNYYFYELNICYSKYFYTQSKYSLNAEKKCCPFIFGGEKCQFHFVKHKHMSRFPCNKIESDQNFCESPTQPLWWLHVNLLYLTQILFPHLDSQLPVGIWIKIDRIILYLMFYN